MTPTHIMPIKIGPRLTRMLAEGRITENQMIYTAHEQYNRLQIYFWDGQMEERFNLDTPKDVPVIYLRRVRDYLLRAVADGKVPNSKWLERFRDEACRQILRASAEGRFAVTP